MLDQAARQLAGSPGDVVIVGGGWLGCRATKGSKYTPVVQVRVWCGVARRGYHQGAMAWRGGWGEKGECSNVRVPRVPVSCHLLHVDGSAWVGRAIALATLDCAVFKFAGGVSRGWVGGWVHA